MDEKKQTTEDQKALQVKIQNQLETLSKEDQLLFGLYASENQGPKMRIPEIRVNYDEDNGVRGGFIAISYEEGEAGGAPKKVINFLDTTIEITIMRTRFKFGYFDQDKGEKGMEAYGTPEMDGYDAEVNLYDNEEKKIIFTGPYKAFKKYISETYPDPRLEQKGFAGSIIKHTEILYVELEGKIHRMYLSKTARDNYWKYKEDINGVPTFAFKTKLTTTKEKSGSITYFPILFEKTTDNELGKYIHLRKKLDEDLKVFDTVRENLKEGADENTVKIGNPEEEIVKKYKLNLGADFKNPACPKCNATTVLRDSFKGPFFGCANFPNCKGTIKLEDVISKTETLPIVNVDEEEKKDDINVENIPF